MTFTLGIFERHRACRQSVEFLTIIDNDYSCTYIGKSYFSKQFSRVNACMGYIIQQLPKVLPPALPLIHAVPFPEATGVFQNIPEIL